MASRKASVPSEACGNDWLSDIDWQPVGRSGGLSNSSRSNANSMRTILMMTPPQRLILSGITRTYLNAPVKKVAWRIEYPNSRTKSLGNPPWKKMSPFPRLTIYNVRKRIYKYYILKNTANTFTRIPMELNAVLEAPWHLPETTSTTISQKHRPLPKLLNQSHQHIVKETRTLHSRNLSYQSLARFTMVCYISILSRSANTRLSIA